MDSIRDNFTQKLPTNSVRVLEYPWTPLLANDEQFAFLVGGFATNPWLSEQLEKRLVDLGFRFSKPDTHT